MNLRLLFLVIACACFASSTLSTRAEAQEITPSANLASSDRHRWAAEVNVLWPFFPGGITEFRLLIPLRTGDGSMPTELVVGTYADFASRVVRGDQDGKVRTLAGKLGLRQFFWRGLHAEASANLGWRNEVERPDGNEYDAFQVRLWLLAGYQHQFSERFYANTRVALGVHVYRSDRFEHEERQFAPGADLNLGVRF